ncbi:uncharacterized protein [Leptinotarsa decemlineata]|uniref:uncharacterized protein n=1 Tax=Leptinotarsa decemlineata TaxID=7539 RepID=UPI003D308B16
MVKNVSLLLFAVLVLGVTSVPTRQRRQFVWENYDDLGNLVNVVTSPSVSSTTTGTTTTRAPASFRRCLTACRNLTTQEYNPVCGTNGETYHNRGALNCGARCGANVQFFRMGTCQPL